MKRNEAVPSPHERLTFPDLRDATARVAERDAENGPRSLPDWQALSRILHGLWTFHSVGNVRLSRDIGASSRISLARCIVFLQCIAGVWCADVTVSRCCVTQTPDIHWRCARVTNRYC